MYIQMKILYIFYVRLVLRQRHIAALVVWRSGDRAW